MGGGEVQVRLGRIHHLQVALLIHHPDLLHHQRGAPGLLSTGSRPGARDLSRNGIDFVVGEGTFVFVFQSVLVDFCHFLQMKNIFSTERLEATQGRQAAVTQMAKGSGRAVCPVGPEPRWAGWAGQDAHQDEGIHDVLANLQAGGARHFQKQVTSGFLNLQQKLDRFQERIKLSQADPSNCKV